jgi:5-oxoprolinase (ATP-hydrolysing) subunit A
VLSNSDDVSAQALSLVTRGEVRATDGAVITLAVDTICLHGDTPGAAALARLVRAALEQAGVDVRARGAHV